MFKFSDAFYICTLISMTACATVSTAPPERGELLKEEVRSEHTAEDASLLKQAVDEMSRYRSMDRLIPSPHNVVTVAALEVSAPTLHAVRSIYKSKSVLPSLDSCQYDSE